MRLAALICHAPISSICFIDAERQWCKAMVGGYAKETSRETSFCAYTILEPGLTIVPDTRMDTRFANNPVVIGELELRFYAGAPLLSDDGYALGALCVADHVPRTLTPDQEDALCILARQVANQMRSAQRLAERERVDAVVDSQRQELAKINAELTTLITTDGLTGLYDRRAFQERLGDEVHRASRYKTPLSLILLDIDDFKGYNDAFGHQAGDAVLIRVARLLDGSVRAHDLAARYGGEEFVLILPQTDSIGAMADAERIRTTIEGEAWLSRPITASFGVATLDLGEDGTVLIARADKALYQAKAAGRNRVDCAPHSNHSIALPRC